MNKILLYINTIFLTIIIILLIIILAQIKSFTSVPPEVDQTTELSDSQNSDDKILTELNVETDQYKSLLKAGNFTFLTPKETFVAQADAGGKSSISIYMDKESFPQASSIIYSIIFFAASEFETGESFSFNEWRTRENIHLTGRSETIGGLEFVEGSKSELSLFHYFAETENERAYVISLPIVKTYNNVGILIQESLNFNPTAEELERAKNPQ